jgi:hypothetical protein
MITTFGGRSSGRVGLPAHEAGVMPRIKHIRAIDAMLQHLMPMSSSAPHAMGRRSDWQFVMAEQSFETREGCQNTQA